MVRMMRRTMHRTLVGLGDACAVPWQWPHRTDRGRGENKRRFGIWFDYLLHALVQRDAFLIFFSFFSTASVPYLVVLQMRYLFPFFPLKWIRQIHQAEDLANVRYTKWPNKIKKRNENPSDVNIQLNTRYGMASLRMSFTRCEGVASMTFVSLI